MTGFCRVREFRRDEVPAGHDAALHESREVARALAPAQEPPVAVAKQRGELAHRRGEAAPAHECQDVKRIELAVACKDLVGALSIEQHRNAVFACLLHDQPLRIQARRRERLLLVPDQVVEILEQARFGRCREMAGDAGRVDHAPRPRTLVELGLWKAGCEGMNGVT